MHYSKKQAENGDFVVSLKYPVYFPIMKECQVPETRRKLLIAFDSRCVNENTKIFEEVLQLRSQVIFFMLSTFH
jgi:neurolysin